MARRRRSVNRDAIAISSRPRLVLRIVRRPSRPFSTVILLRDPLLDRRVFHPDRQFRPVGVAYRRSARRIVAARPFSAWSSPQRVGFAVPREVKRCVQRKERREVLHAFNRISSGKGRAKRRDFYSSVSCK